MAKRQPDQDDTSEGLRRHQQALSRALADKRPNADPGADEKEYRRIANLHYGGDIYGPLKGPGWEKKINKKAAEYAAGPNTYTPDVGKQRERDLRRGKK